MARGFESKSVADQQESAQARRGARAERTARPEVSARKRRLELARADVERRLASASVPSAPPDARAGAPRPRRTTSSRWTRPGAPARVRRGPLARAPRRERTRSPPAPRHVADYDIRVRLDAEAKTLDGHRAHHLAQPRERAGGRALVPPLPERLQELREHVLPRVGRPAARRPHARRGLGLDRREVAARRGRRGARAERPLRAARRRQRRRPDGVAACRCPSPCRRAGSSSSTSSSTRSCRGSSRAPATSATTSWSASGSRSSRVYEPAGMRGRARRRLELPPVPRQLGVLRRLRPLQGRDHAAEATSSSARPGTRTERRENADGTATHVFERSDVIDFAWTASPRFVEVKQRFSGEQDVSAAGVRRGGGAPRPQPRRGAAQRRRHRACCCSPSTCRSASATSARRQGRDQVVRALVRPLSVPDAHDRRPGLRRGRLGRDGVPDLHHGRHLGAAQPLAARPRAAARGGDRSTSSATSTGRAWWPRNEFEESWLDEGFNSYSTGKVREQRLRASGCCEAFGLRLGGLEPSRMQNSVERMFDRIRTPAWGYSSSGNYGFNSYSRTELTLRTLEALIGAQTMARVMRTYHERCRFRHPSSDDFYAVVSEVAGRDLTAFFAQTIERPGILDDEVSLVTSEPVDEPRGVFGEGAARKTVTKKEAAREGRAGQGGRQARLAHDRGGAPPRRGGAARPRCASTTRGARRRRCRSLELDRRAASSSRRSPRRRRDGRALARPLQAGRAGGGPGSWSRRRSTPRTG